MGKLLRCAGCHPRELLPCHASLESAAAALRTAQIVYWGMELWKSEYQGWRRSEEMVERAAAAASNRDVDAVPLYAACTYVSWIARSAQDLKKRKKKEKVPPAAGKSGKPTALERVAGLLVRPRVAEEVVDAAPEPSFWEACEQADAME